MDTSSSISSSSSFSSSLNNVSSGFLASNANQSFPHTPSSLARRWKGSDRETPRFFCESISTAAGAHHFLDACFLCKKPIAANDDIFMYRGDAPFCSKECREQQMEMDEALENNRKKFSYSSSSSLKNSSSSSVSSTIKRKPSLIIRQNPRNVHAVVAGY